MKHLKKGQFQGSEDTVKKKVRKLRKREVLDDGRKKNKRPEVLSQVELDQVSDKLVREPELSAPALVASLKFDCCARTLNRHLKNNGYRYLRILKEPLMNNKHKQERITFAQNHSRDHEWKNTFFLDESKFEAFSRKFVCHKKPNERVVKGRPKHPPKINLIGVISYNGPSRLIIFTDNMNAKLFLKFFKLLEKDAKVLYSGRKYRIYLDKDSQHTADNTKDY